MTDYHGNVGALYHAVVGWPVEQLVEERTELAASARPLLFQNDHSILLMVESPRFAEARDRLRRFAELRQAAGPYHVYRATEVSLWSAAAARLSAVEIVTDLLELGQNAPPAALIAHIQQVVGNYGLIRLSGTASDLRLTASDVALLRSLAESLDLERDGDRAIVPASKRGWVKARLAELGYPVVDEAALLTTKDLHFTLRDEIQLRPYQQRAVSRFCDDALPGGVVLLPCGAGKTVVGVAAAARLSARTLVITPSRTVCEQWRDHFRTMTTLPDDAVSIYRRGAPLAPVTIATYQALTSRGRDAGGLSSVLDQPWGLIVYDEVHSLPADVFRQSASVQSVKRLGLTATLIREDGREREVFSLVGPTLFSAPWRELERHGWIAPVDCVEVRIRIADRRQLSPDRILAAKLKVLRRILARHRDEPTLIVAHRLKEVAAVAHAVDVPVVTGQTSAEDRRKLFEDFRNNRQRTLALSRVANVGVDLPDASLMIQLSGAFGSRQEEAQRVGRVLRPKAPGTRSRFYTLVIAGTNEIEFAARRQRFLVDQGYHYRVFDVEAG